MACCTPEPDLHDVLHGSSPDAQDLLSAWAIRDWSTPAPARVGDDLEPLKAFGVEERAGAKPLPLLVFSHLRWHFVTQRPQHLMVRAARTRPVFFWEEPYAYTPEQTA